MRDVDSGNNMRKILMDNKDISFDIYQPFGPSILKTKLPQAYVDALNQQSDKILNDEALSKEHDWSHNLAGNVKKEVAIDHMKIKGFPEFLAVMSEEYSKRVLPDPIPAGTKIAFRVWTVSQWAGDFNPMHIHDSNLSGVCFLKIQFALLYILAYVLDLFAFASLSSVSFMLVALRNKPHLYQ